MYSLIIWLVIVAIQLAGFNATNSFFPTRILRRKPPKKFPHIIIAGPPSVGKGTLCSIMSKKFGFVHISSGDLLRESVTLGDHYKNKFEKYMKSGQLVPDSCIVDIIHHRLACKDCADNGWLLDGFPRSKTQATALAKMGHTIDGVIILDAPISTILERGLGRVVDPITGRVYHKTHNPPPEGVRDRVICRSDDTEDTLLKRYEEYKMTVEQLFASYSCDVNRVDASQDMDKCIGDIEMILDRHIQRCSVNNDRIV